MAQKPTIHELEKILDEDPGSIELMPDGSVRVLDVGLPSPVEVAANLMASMPEDHAKAIAAEVYQPLSNLLRKLAVAEYEVYQLTAKERQYE